MLRHMRNMMNIHKLTMTVLEVGARGLAQPLESFIRSWDMDTMVSKLEAQVGNDLQYIRLNGSFVGGLIGLLIFVGVSLAAM